MSRPIKFRAWNKVMKKMYHDISQIMLPCETEEAYYIYMQYTGLKDKNGKEIYEGDIVKANYYAFNEGKDHKIKGEIIYDTEQFVGYRIGDTRMSAATNFEVIGNIYENKDLLK